MSPLELLTPFNTIPDMAFHDKNLFLDAHTSPGLSAVSQASIYTLSLANAVTAQNKQSTSPVSQSMNNPLLVLAIGGGLAASLAASRSIGVLGQYYFRSPRLVGTTPPTLPRLMQSNQVRQLMSNAGKETINRSPNNATTRAMMGWNRSLAVRLFQLTFLHLTKPKHPVLPKDFSTSATLRLSYQCRSQTANKKPLQTSTLDTFGRSKLKASKIAKLLILSNLRLRASHRFYDESRKQVKKLEDGYKAVIKIGSQFHDWTNYQNEVIAKKGKVAADFQKDSDEFAWCLAEGSSEIIWNEEKRDWQFKYMGTNGPLLSSLENEKLEAMVKEINAKVS